MLGLDGRCRPSPHESALLKLSAQGKTGVAKVGLSRDNLEDCIEY